MLLLEVSSVVDDGGSNKHYKLIPEAMFTILKIIMNLSSFASLSLRRSRSHLYNKKPQTNAQHLSLNIKVRKP